MKDGGELADVFTQATSIFGFLNPMSWFQPQVRSPARMDDGAIVAITLLWDESAWSCAGCMRLRAADPSRMSPSMHEPQHA